MKYSWQRQIILEIIQEKKQHLSAQQIYGLARERCPHISLGTVYRNLNTLADNHMVGRVGMISGAECFDWDPASHEHFYCQKCRRVFNLDLPEGQLSSMIRAVPGIRAEGHSLTVTGLCPDCAAEQ
ncbi:MAG: transcriptional repressor [Gemmiger sp.]|uniref:Fur family transcriptional regulator n=1 Tax=Gemmiger sp. TaxID=2049027 RepID=UPI002E7AA56D|nr:transcriptional repressor [Gemmiger sp.]MEE0800469.1 transcriptional repressor [Gemmiger sp.]